VHVLEDWCEPFSGHFLYDPGHRQPSPAFSLVVDSLRYSEELIGTPKKKAEPRKKAGAK
jgi:hypothetical protein